MQDLPPRLQFICDFDKISIPEDLVNLGRLRAGLCLLSSSGICSIAWLDGLWRGT